MELAHGGAKGSQMGWIRNSAEFYVKVLECWSKKLKQGAWQVYQEKRTQVSSLLTPTSDTKCGERCSQLFISTGCPTVRLWCELPGVSTGPTDQPTSDTKYKSPTVTCNSDGWQNIEGFYDSPSSGLIICQTGSQNGGKHIYWFITTQLRHHQRKEMPRAMSVEGEQSFHAFPESKSFSASPCIHQPGSSANHLRIFHGGFIKQA